MKALLLSLALAAWAIPASADSWKDLGQKLIQRENYSRDYGQYVLTHVVPNDRAQPRQADYLVTSAVLSHPDGTMEPAFVRAGVVTTSSHAGACTATFCLKVAA